MLFLRSLLHTVFMVVTVIPFTLVILLLRLLGANTEKRWAVARNWLALSIHAARWFCGIHYRVQGMEYVENQKDGLVLLVKHQSTYETFLMPAMMPRPLAFVFKKELLNIPFFGWSIGSLDMIHIDRSQRARAFLKVVEQGQRLLARGVWVIMFPEGTRVPRGQAGDYQSGAARLAIMNKVPVVPVAVTSARCWPKTGFIRKPGIVDVSIGKPISTENRKHDELTQEVKNWIETEMRRLDPQAYFDNPENPPA